MDSRKRSTLLTLGLIVAGYAALRSVPSWLLERLEFEPLDSPAGYRKYVAGGSSSGFNPLIGLGTTDVDDNIAQKEAAVVRVLSDLCNALFGELGTIRTQVPVASFSDYNCPFCRVQTKHLADMASAMPEQIAIAWHELPLLGETSKLAARAALAAKRQGAYARFHEHLMTTPFRPSRQYLARLAVDLGIDGGQLAADMESAEITRELEDSWALARVFGFVGIPALVIGRTVVQGQINERMITKIIDLERKEGWDAACVSA